MCQLTGNIIWNIISNMIPWCRLCIAMFHGLHCKHTVLFTKCTVCIHSVYPSI